MTGAEIFTLTLGIIESAAVLVKNIVNRPDCEHLRELALQRLQAIHDDWEELPGKQAARQAELDARIPPKP